MDLIERTGARLLVDQLLIQGVNQVFCVPGESYLGVLDALSDFGAAVRLTVNRHESGSVFMADAYARLTGQPGVAFVTRGPGASNAAIGIHNARQDSTPLVLFIGQVDTEHLGREATSGDLYLFVSRDRIRAKVLWWDGTGLCIFAKRLEQGRFAALWGRVRDGQVELSSAELALFLEGCHEVGRRPLSPPAVSPHRKVYFGAARG